MSDSEIGALRQKLTSRVRSDDYRQRRKDMDAGFLQYGIARDVSVEPVTANGVRAEWDLDPRGRSRRGTALRARRRLRHRLARQPPTSGFGSRPRRKSLKPMQY